jgi:hypothetical protein
MANHSSILSDAEARRLANTGTLFVVRPVVPQPEWKGAAPDRITDVMGGFVDGVGVRHAAILGAVGNTLLCKEAFWFLWPENCDNGLIYDEEHREYGRPVRDDECSVEYRADTMAAHPGEWPDDEPDAPRWNPASRMPLWAVRYRPVVVEAGVMRVGKMPDSDAKATGVFPARLYSDMMREEHGGSEYRCAFHEYWNRRYPKYPYEASPWVWTAFVKMPEQAERDEWAQRGADKQQEMEQDMWEEEHNG